MNEFFSLPRFGRLFLKHTIEHYRTYLMAFAVLTGVLLLGGLFLFYMLPEPPDPGFQTALFGILLLLAGTLFTSTIFSDLGVKTKALPALTLPASAFEKYLVRWLYSFPIFLIVYTCAFYLMLAGLATMKRWPSEKFELFTILQPDLALLPILYSLLHAVTIYGSIFFEKLHFIKTGFVFFIAYSLAIVANTFFLMALTHENINPALPFAYLSFTSQGKYYSLFLLEKESSMIIVALVMVALLIWAASYFRLKEKQV